MKNWSEFHTGTEDGILALADIMVIMSTPRHSAKFNGKYMSTASEYAPLFFEKLKAITRKSSFWDPSPVPSGDSPDA